MIRPQHGGARCHDAPVHGFTVIELVVSLTVMAIAVTGAGSLGQTAVRVWALHQARLDTQQAARRGLDRMVEELRWAEVVVADPLCGPTGLCSDRIAVQIPAGNPYRGDEPYAVAFQYNPQQRELERRVGRGVNNLASLIQRLTLSYVDPNGAAAPGPPDVASIMITLVAAPRGGAPVILEGQVALRNRL
jgi:prepilin-type N-terminal cleavage/methylation domain-containing protein